MGLQNNIIGYLTDVGFDSMYAASIFSLMMFILVPGKIALGSIYDRFGIRIGSIVITVTLSLSAVLLILSVRSPSRSSSPLSSVSATPSRPCSSPI